VHPDIAVRVVGLFHDSEVPGRDFVHDDRWGIAPSITVGAGGPITASVDYYHLETDGMPDYGIPLTSPGQLADGTREPADVDHDNFYGLLARDFQETQVDAFTFRFSADLSRGLTLSNVTRYSDTFNDYIVTNPDDSAGNVQNGTVWRNIKSRNSKSSGVVSNTNLSAIFDTGGIGHSLAIGFEFNDTDSFNTPYVVDTGSYRFNPAVPGSGCNAQGLAEGNCAPLVNPDPRDPWNGAISASTTPSRAESDEVSLYLFDTIQIAPSLILNGGLRWTDFSARGSGCARGSCFDVENESDFWSYQAGVIFKPTEATSIYASYADSSTPPGTTVGEGAENIGADSDLYQPQETENWEIGAKAELFGGALLLTGAAFRIDRGNILPIDPVVDDQIIQAARLQGFEVGATGTLGPVTMLVGYTYIDSELREDAVLEDNDPTNDDLANVGNTLPQTPEHNLAATLDWQVLPQLSMGAGAYAASERFADAANVIRADGYVRFDAHAQFDISENLTARINVNNVLDERYVVKLRNPHFAVPAEGRQAIVSLTARY
jgi:catecholate siderophore receptor